MFCICLDYSDSADYRIVFTRIEFEGDTMRTVGCKEGREKEGREKRQEPLWFKDMKQKHANVRCCSHSSRYGKSTVNPGVRPARTFYDF